MSTSLRRRSPSSSSPTTQERNSIAKPWPYMYRPASPGMLGLPSWPLGMARDISQSAARRMLSLYLPSRMVLPSMSMAMPAMAVMVTGYWPPNASQWPSRDWFLASHSRPLLTVGRYLAGNSSARAAGPAADSSRQPARAPDRVRARMGLVSLERPARWGRRPHLTLDEPRGDF